jgi:transcriptional regulator with XRE-family HTH domain
MAATQGQIARRLCLDVSTVNKILNRRSGPVFKKETIKRVFKVAKDLGYDFGRLKYQHRRKYPRRSIAIPIELSIYLEGGKLYDRGTGLLQEVSLSGAKLSAVVLPGRAIPIVSHSIGIRIPDGPLKDVEILGHAVRLYPGEGAVGFAVEFLTTEESKAEQLLALRA